MFSVEKIGRLLDDPEIRQNVYDGELTARVRRRQI
jgi:hypothetical protein